MLCQLSYDHHVRFFSKAVKETVFLENYSLDQKADAKVLLFFELCKYLGNYFQKKHFCVLKNDYSKRFCQKTEVISSQESPTRL